MDKEILAKQKINNIDTFNLLKRLGIKTSTKGIKYLLNCIRIGYYSDSEYLNMEKIYLEMSEKYNVSPTTIKISIKQSLENRNVHLAQNNFKSIFGYEYNEYTFTNKEFIEEIIRLLN